MEECFRLLWQAGCEGRIADGQGRQAWGAQDNVSEEVTKCHDGQCMPGGQPAWLLPAPRGEAWGSHLIFLCLSFLLC